MINHGYLSAPWKYISSKSWWMASSYSSFSYRRQFNTHNTAKQQFGTRGRSPSSASIVKWQYVFAVFASLYGCVLVTTSAAKLLEVGLSPVPILAGRPDFQPVSRVPARPSSGRLSPDFLEWEVDRLPEWLWYNWQISKKLLKYPYGNVFLRSFSCPAMACTSLQRCSL